MNNHRWIRTRHGTLINANYVVSAWESDGVVRVETVTNTSDCGADWEVGAAISKGADTGLMARLEEWLISGETAVFHAID